MTWRDFRTVTGEYHDALPLPDSGPDPVQVDDVSSHALPVQDLAFDAAQYDAEVARASADRSGSPQRGSEAARRPTADLRWIGAAWWHRSPQRPDGRPGSRRR